MACFRCRFQKKFLATLFKAIEAEPDTQFTVNLEEQRITLVSTGESESFEINPYKKECLLNGYDDIDFLLSIKDQIAQFEKERT
jgi:3-isopropylmalate/(R)-2-methylmalate dehydratase small subunit